MDEIGDNSLLFGSNFSLIEFYRHAVYDGIDDDVV